MSSEKTAGGFLALSRQGGAILAVGTFAWCLAGDMTLIESAFRAGTVWIVVSIISYIFVNTLARITEETTDLRIEENPETESEKS